MPCGKGSYLLNNLQLKAEKNKSNQPKKVNSLKFKINSLKISAFFRMFPLWTWKKFSTTESWRELRFLNSECLVLKGSRGIVRILFDPEDPIKDFFSKYDQIHSFLRIWSHLLKKSVTENFIFCAVCMMSFFEEIVRVRFIFSKMIREFS